MYTDNKRYHTWDHYLKNRFDSKVFKIALNAGFTCPNIDGTKGSGGCTYCSAGSGDFAGDPHESITDQFRHVKEMLHKKWKKALYIPYFQANTNTYAPLPLLREKFETAMAEDGVVGLSIATRADCLEEELLDYLSELNRRTYLIVELGLQTTFDETGIRINRCHTYADFLDGYDKLRQRNINVCVHLINGLPGEDADMMLTNAKRVAALRPHCIKLHLLHILKNTPMEQEYIEGKIKTLTLEEYVRTVSEQLRYFHEDTIIQRLTGDGGRDTLVAPEWSLKKFVVLNEIDKFMKKYDIFQGDKFEGENYDL